MNNDADKRPADHEAERILKFHLGIVGAIIPFLFFIVGVIIIALSGAPDEKGFWPVLILALGLGLLLAKDRTLFAKSVIKGMSQEIVMIMITAWILASINGVLMTATGFVEALTWVSALIALNHISIVIITFIICCVVSLSTGSSFATILICGPILYPAGGTLGAHLPLLAGSIIAGATFGDFIAPISDTTIASALSQKADIGSTVRSRIKYIAPVSMIALLAYGIAAFLLQPNSIDKASILSGSPDGWPMILVPVFIIYLFLKGKHLLHGLLIGLLFALAIGLGFGLIPFHAVFSLDLENFTARSVIIDGIDRAVGLSFFTILLMGLVGSIQASGLTEAMVDFAEHKSHNKKDGESWIAGMVGLAVLLTTHSIVAILMVSDFAAKTGNRLQISPVRRANLLSLVVCVFPFLLPYFIPVILMANTTNTGAEYGLSTVSPVQVGLYNFVAWGLMVMVLATSVFGYGRKSDNQL